MDGGRRPDRNFLPLPAAAFSSGSHGLPEGPPSPFYLARRPFFAKIVEYVSLIISNPRMVFFFIDMGCIS